MRECAGRRRVDVAADEPRDAGPVRLGAETASAAGVRATASLLGAERSSARARLQSRHAKADLTAGHDARVGDGWPRPRLTRPWRVARLGDALGLEPALGVDGGLAAVAGGRHRLAVAMVVDVAGDEHAVDLRAGLVADDEVALLVDLEPVAEDLRVGL